MSINVILPCAGEGKRLGLPYPKEIHQVANGVSLIDLSMRLLQPFREQVGRVTIVVSPQKAAVMSYMAKWKDEFPLAFCFFDDRYFEWAGSIRSGEHLFMEKNLVLLPDSLVEEDAARRVVPTMNAMLDRSSLVFGYVRERAERLRHLGALAVEGDRVTAFCDKPADDLARFNAFWGTFGFRGEAAGPILETMTRSIRREAVDLASFGQREVGAFPLSAYTDLGTWNNLASLRDGHLALARGAAGAAAA
jgi:hypothetical protein